jgi:hypothetical protein
MHLDEMHDIGERSEDDVLWSSKRANSVEIACMPVLLGSYAPVAIFLPNMCMSIGAFICPWQRDPC